MDEYVHEGVDEHVDENEHVDEDEHADEHEDVAVVDDDVLRDGNVHVEHDVHWGHNDDDERAHVHARGVHHLDVLDWHDSNVLDVHEQMYDHDLRFGREYPHADDVNDHARHLDSHHQPCCHQQLRCSLLDWN